MSSVDLFFEKHCNSTTLDINKKLLDEKEIKCEPINFVNIDNIVFDVLYIKVDDQNNSFICDLHMSNIVQVNVVGIGDTLENCIINMLSQINIWHRCQTCLHIHDYHQSNICYRCFEVTQLSDDDKFSCVICTITQSNDNRKVFFCGHNEMCKMCWFKMSGFKCPICRQDTIKTGPMIILK